MTTPPTTPQATYVFDNVEVRKTSRVAYNTLRSGKVDILIEVTPVDQIVGSWKRWVKEETLFTVQPAP